MKPVVVVTVMKVVKKMVVVVVIVTVTVIGVLVNVKMKLMLMDADEDKDAEDGDNGGSGDDDTFGGVTKVAVVTVDEACSTSHLETSTHQLMGHTS
ncbi:hypothetical protein H671_5g14910 [Cricetulus griseus]|uniref:Uncharacterized protein n=1 Tax=Cricetulus griseus TaxID=10029 RepID=A0A061HYV5_CRIGR|nr:hypothetical protein H671_5g14910 [Cricetulus griseus]